jgi:hypothetical protein
MRQTIITLGIVGTILTILAFTKSENKSVGAIGDVKYSILPPDKFKEENGNGWVLMDNNIPLQGSNLNTKHGLTSIPDARGLFIRGLNLRRNDSYSDLFSMENGRERMAGEYQLDGIKKHKHNFSDAYFAEINCGNQGLIGSKSSDSDNGRCESNDVTDDGIALIEETRPKNIALYTYIKIND